MSKAAVRYPYIGGALDGLSVAFENMGPTPMLKINGEVYRYGLWPHPQPRFVYAYAGRYEQTDDARDPKHWTDSYGDDSE